MKGHVLQLLVILLIFLKLTLDLKHLDFIEKLLSI